MEHTSNLCQKPGCTDPHPYHNENGTIHKSMRPIAGGLLSDEMESGRNLVHPLEVFLGYDTRGNPMYRLV
jgi:hypothetical protein